MAQNYHDPRFWGVIASAGVSTAAYFVTTFVIGSITALLSRDLSWDSGTEVAGRWLHLPTVAVYGFVFFLIIIVVVGLPLDLLLRRFKRTSLISYGVVGAAAGALFGLALATLLPAGFVTNSDNPRALTDLDWAMLCAQLGLLGGLMGAIAACVFRYAVLRQRID